VVSISDQVSDKLRVGVQMHMYQLGDFGGPALQVDWPQETIALTTKLDLPSEVKTVIGLFNDTQDVDAVHLWALLPRAFTLSTIKLLAWPLRSGFSWRYDLGERGGRLAIAPTQATAPWFG